MWMDVRRVETHPDDCAPTPIAQACRCAAATDVCSPWHHPPCTSLPLLLIAPYPSTAAVSSLSTWPCYGLDFGGRVVHKKTYISHRLRPCTHALPMPTLLGARGRYLSAVGTALAATAPVRRRRKCNVSTPTSCACITGPMLCRALYLGNACSCGCFQLHAPPVPHRLVERQC